ncbi:phosphoribosylaminoimidazolesuccinocarboxamide synthase [Paremcibacter congregatus]|uniref:Phosphoribosylaminoimidazole-succinocarboxamide synthase n=1 Tax=Paremcibacter congregatus TaxID=2043170 RepID=A0A2G4YT00_9PROT|nr:phosphoribosylaminoimidazolesuccinocarboxamide synthase [Paremcibacter congregatus]PHZ85380.1 phosphoribosylaminoimidazolesuccinocarboxamide synthase [Paremcibacter congregatus]QDE27688.1 phosphoribosylaminoimidazolesuccinocarboxamide synthase [Paremcibacter congregatus]|tara:strand:+ start:3377 stop:4117 length:741 start_codon:yes stop_codon:yes gene_type:complete
MPKGEKLYEGKAKVLYKGTEPGTIVQYFKDDATAFNAQKKGTIAGKGIINNKVTELVMHNLERIGIPTHFIERLSDREQLVREVEIVPLEVIVRNVVAGTMAKRLGMEEGIRLERPLVEFSLKDDALGDPLIAEEHILSLDLADEDELSEIFDMTHQINDFLRGMFAGIGIELIDFKLEFGRLYEEDEVSYSLILADEFSPDNCRLWDLKTGEKMDKDRFRRDLGGEVEAYQEVARRLGISLETEE